MFLEIYSVRKSKNKLKIIIKNSNKMDKDEIIDSFYSYLRLLRAMLEEYEEGSPEYEELLSEIRKMEKIERLIF